MIIHLKRTLPNQYVAKTNIGEKVGDFIEKSSTPIISEEVSLKNDTIENIPKTINTMKRQPSNPFLMQPQVPKFENHRI